jgi:hypothetical protein
MAGSKELRWSGICGHLQILAWAVTQLWSGPDICGRIAARTTEVTIVLKANQYFEGNDMEL